MSNATATQQYSFCPWCLSTFQAPSEPCPNCNLAKNIHLPSALSFADFSRLLASWSEFGEYAALSIDRWIRSLHGCVYQLTNSTDTQTNATAQLFWIKLHGALMELPESYAMFDGVLATNDIVKHGARVGAAALALKDALSTDEHIYVQWARHREGHIKQNGYRLQLQSNGTIVYDRMGIQALKDPGVHVDDHWKAIDALMGQHAGCAARPFNQRADTKVAIAIAQKIRTHVEALVDAQQGYMDVAGPDAR